MIKKIKVADLKSGMYVHELNCSWIDHPFLYNSFKLQTAQEIEKINECGIQYLYIDTNLGFDTNEQPDAKDDIHRNLNATLLELGRNPRSQPSKQVTLEEEVVQAKQIYQEASDIVQNTLQDVRVGKQVELEKLEPVVSAVTESIFRNPDAILSLLRIKQVDKYTFQHSVAASALLISFCRDLGLQRSLIEQVGVGGLLHDIGKMKIPKRLLNKPGKLSEKEYSVMKKHVNYGSELVADIKGISQVSANIVAEHHERCNGSGYPNSLSGDGISLYGQMAAIVDVYDALTSNRIYHQKAEPTAVLKKLLLWSDHEFNKSLVHQFIRTIGIYPVGSLVRLDSGYLAVVIEQHHENLLYPKVRKIFNTRTNSFVTPIDMDITKIESSDHIVSFEIPEYWHIDIGAYMNF